ncbi:unnamed protein product [Orchesella dallaii]|uniref:Uncharacterized protein n=1 Tax=Orchesella dallaii TaxID=48710 RepID=A0ABP1PSF1_9HEXA
MEFQQKKYIIANLDKLVQCTTCNALLLAKLRLHDVLSANDCDSLDALKFEGKMSQSLKLYEVVITRADSFDLLAQVLRETGQTEAARILFEGSEDFQALSQLLYENTKSKTSSCQQLIPTNTDEASFQALISNAFKSEAILDLLNEERNITFISTVNLSLTSTLLKIGLQNEKKNFASTTYPFNFKPDGNGNNGNTLLVTLTNNLEEYLENVRINGKILILITTLKPHEIFTALKASSKATSILKSSKIAKHGIKWGDLKLPYKKQLLQRSVRFQNVEVCLEDLVSPYHNSFPDFINDTVNEELLAALLFDQKPLLCHTTVPSPLSQKCYVKRKFSTCFLIKSLAIFQNDLIVVTGIREFDLQIFTKNRGIEVIKDISKVENLSRNTSLILMKNPSIELFQTMSSHLNKQAHWLHFAGTHFEHCMSYGLTPRTTRWELVKKIEGAKSSSSGIGAIGEHEILKQFGNETNSIITILGPSGSGKSTVLASIATEISSANPTHFVGFFVLAELVQKICTQVGSSGELKINAIISVMINNCGNCFLAKRLLELKFAEEIGEQVSVNADIFLDGLDEVSPTLMHFCIQILIELRRGIKNARIWLSTSFEQLESLQDCTSLNLIQFQLEPLSLQESCQFMLTSWEGEGLHLQPGLLEAYAKECLFDIQGKLSLPENMEYLTPLILSQFAKLSKDSAHGYSATVEHFGVCHSNSCPIPSSLAELYSQIVELTMNDHLSKLNVINSSEGDWYTRGRIRRHHMLFALQQLFPDWAHSFLKYFEHERNASPSELLPFGFVIQTGQSQSFRFVHRSIAEYFLASFLIDLGTDNNYVESLGDSLGKFLNDIIFSIKLDRCDGLQEYIVQFQYERIIHFLNDLIIKKTAEEKKRFSKIFLKFRKVGEDYLGKNELSPLVATIRCKASALFKILFLESMSAAISEATPTSYWFWDFTLLKICSKYSDFGCFQMVEHLTELNIDKSRCLSIETLFKYAMYSGNVDVFNYLMYNRRVGRNLWSKAVHRCVSNSEHQSSSVIQGKLKIIQFFANASPSLINETDKKGRTPLLKKNAHIVLLKELIVLGANVNAVEFLSTKNTVLHILADSRVSPQDFHEFLLFANTHGINLKLQNKKGETSLHVALAKFELLPASVEIYATSGLAFDAPDKNCNTLLHIAAKFGRSRELIDALIHHEAKPETKNKVGETFIHFLAQTTDLETFQYFVEKIGSKLLASKSSEQNTVFHHALANKSSKNVYEILNFLLNQLKLNLDVINTRNANEETPICVGIRYGKGNLTVEVLNLLQNAGVDILGNDKEATLTVLFEHSVEFEESEFLSICKLLKKAGANFHCRWKDGVALIHWAVRGRSLRIVKFLIEECGVDVNVTHEGTGNNALHIAFEDTKVGLFNAEVASYLIECGVNEHQENKGKMNPLAYGASLVKGSYWSANGNMVGGNVGLWFDYLLHGFQSGGDSGPSYHISFSL